MLGSALPPLFAELAAAAAPLRGLRATCPLLASSLLLWGNLANTLCVGFGQTGRRSAAAKRLYLHRWPQRHGCLPGQLLAFLQEEGGIMRDIEQLMAWLLWLRRGGGGLWRRYIDLLPQGNATPPQPLAFSRWSSCNCKPWRQLPATIAASLSPCMSGCSAASLASCTGCAGGDALSLLVPCADFANHSQQPNCVFWLSEEAAAFQLVALENQAAGGEVTIRYGPSCSNDQLLRQYGFTLQGNAWDRLPLLATAGSVGLPAASAPPAALSSSSRNQQPPAGLSAPRLLAAMHAAAPLFAR
ncbi:ribulose-1,5 bisphosphate carboxylase oxygenase large subunit N- chloroplastic [Chlorella sorokiniana]|uniref:Ribulose-1,5 bisphosphate carboxylase oxygenase large subunit N-chloroplastic n=1 Tax=Chlorella sorokiniana TaxID=3076 RepID=A0A2P6TNZ9_CHLSO|nr:ribulose-1,5 bisphosphate carboxylase oxygenase large subunit N- chloroplastic [Chlorella sorokiniana]|eukprot:PRW51052.1 ribulose-1,5 bisphosphate carboxylase oxygenase large subunit N- chloroplastic [Chlorella sorokiniana]